MRNRASRRLLIAGALGLATLWVALSGKLDPLHLGFGVLSLGVVLACTHSLVRSPNSPEENQFIHQLVWHRALLYPFWLAGQVLLANLDIARLILTPRMPIDPVIIEFDTPLEGAIPKVLLGNSITLTPGTFTLDIAGPTFVVHAINEGAASSLILGIMQKRVAAVFGGDDPGDTHIQIGGALPPRRTTDSTTPEASA